MNTTDKQLNSPLSLTPENQKGDNHRWIIASILMLGGLIIALVAGTLPSNHVPDAGIILVPLYGMLFFAIIVPAIVAIWRTTWFKMLKPSQLLLVWFITVIVLSVVELTLSWIFPLVLYVRIVNGLLNLMLLLTAVVRWILRKK